MYCSILLKFGRLLRYGSAERPDLILHLTKTGDMRVLKWQCLSSFLVLHLCRNVTLLEPH